MVGGKLQEKFPISFRYDLRMPYFVMTLSEDGCARVRIDQSRKILATLQAIMIHASS
jgi:hypothetical protein